MCWLVQDAQWNADHAFRTRVDIGEQCNANVIRDTHDPVRFVASIHKMLLAIQTLLGRKELRVRHMLQVVHDGYASHAWSPEVRHAKWTEEKIRANVFVQTRVFPDRSK